MMRSYTIFVSTQSVDSLRKKIAQKEKIMQVVDITKMWLQLLPKLLKKEHPYIRVVQQVHQN